MSIVEMMSTEEVLAMGDASRMSIESLEIYLCLIALCETE